MILYLNGTSSSGKSSVAHAMQKQLQTPIFYFSIDTLLYTLNPQVLEAIQGKRTLKAEINWNSIFHGYFECVRTLGESGNFVIADCPIYSEGLFKLYEQSFQSVKNKYVVALECPVEVCKQREIDRKDRAIGIVAKQFEGIHSFLKYNCKVDTHNSSPEEIAGLLIKTLQLNPN